MLCTLGCTRTAHIVFDEMACVLGGMDIALCIVIVVVVVMGMIAALACLDVKVKMRAMTVYN